MPRPPLPSSTSAPSTRYGEDSRRRNQEHLLGLAQVYKGFDRRQLADALRRDPTKLFPPTGNPKLDYLMSLSEVLDWPVGEVAEAIWGDDVGEGDLPAGLAYEELSLAARDAHKAGQFSMMCRLAHRMYAAATTPQQRALAAHREAGGWDGLGRYTRQLDAIRRGLREGPISGELRLLLQVNLANAYYTLWHLVEARALARDLIDTLEETPPDNKNARAAQAFAHYVLGNACCRLAAQDPDGRTRHAREAKAGFERALALYTGLAQEFDHNPWRGIANTCHGGLIEVCVELGERDALGAVTELAAGLDAVAGDQDNDGLVGDRLESYGWWCVFGCNIALRHLAGRDLQRHMAVFTNKGYEIADRLDNWAMRERLFTMEFLQRRQLDDLVGFPIEWTIDSEEVRVIVGTMGRFPTFRDTGWKILQTATVIGGK